MIRDRFPHPKVRSEIRADGSILLTNLEPLGPYPANLTHNFGYWAQRDPSRIALADRKGAPGVWRSLTYGELWDKTARLGQALMDLGARADRPVLLVSENRIEAALLQFAAARAGLVSAPITPAYSTGPGDPERLRVILDTIDPAIVVVDNASVHLPNLKPLLAAGARVVGMVPSDGALDFAALARGPIGPAFCAAEAKVRGDTPMKVLFTSGSTGQPKGVISTHRMMASNVQAIRQGWTFMDQEPPIVVDWLPWNHTFGGSYVLNSVLAAGGTLYIDDGRPMPGAIRRSVQNNADIRPTLYINAPRGLDMAGQILAEDPALAEAFFDRLRLVFFASAGLPSRIREEWMTLIRRHGKRPIAFVSAWGATETAPLATALNFDAAQINNIGLPIPGVAVKLAPIAGRHELRVKGPNVTPGYWNRPDLSEAAFDEDGFFRTGDVGRLADPEDASAGVLIDGRLAEDFKLASGTWTNVGGIRAQLLEALGPPVRDVVLSGPNRRALSALIFLDVEQCRRQFSLSGADAAVAASEAVRTHVRAALEGHNRDNPGLSRRIAAHCVMARALDPAAGELTDKGAVNQASVLAREALLCDSLDAARPV